MSAFFNNFGILELWTKFYAKGYDETFMTETFYVQHTLNFRNNKWAVVGIITLT